MTTGIANVDVKSIFENAMVNLIIEFPVFATLVTRIGWILIKLSNHCFIDIDTMTIKPSNSSMSRFIN